ncbi:hypothetical protein [Paenibacillus sp. CF384]|uniref:hypothetical protein n=1 Tax=Paenibacillus sp. CF384 TaxID=1884382 RepID=UPI00089A624F|nr:hypothetical protein [Paenibacillus sp. CF384]SDX51810.1 hypothetical protein SAMN05518855_1015151 [Paenibacillus sp. CF384]
MGNEANTNVKCATQRLGKVVAADGKFLAIEVNGKALTLPREKAEAGIVAGDVLRWDGLKWVRAQHSDEAAGQ